MKKRIIIDTNFPTETRVVLLDKNNNIENIEFSSANKKQIKGNIYLAKITQLQNAWIHRYIVAKVSFLKMICFVA